MGNSDINIVIIDDDLEMESRPLYEELIEKYSAEAIFWKKDAEQGVKFVSDNLDRKTIIILDYDFGSQTVNGLKIFQELQKKSSLLYIILYTAKSINEIPNNELKIFINDHLMAFIDKAEHGYKKALLEIEKAISYLNNRVDSILEEWIIRHKFFTTEEPVMRIKNGELIKLKDILIEIRKDSTFGREMKKNIIGVAISLMQNERI